MRTVGGTAYLPKVIFHPGETEGEYEWFQNILTNIGGVNRFGEPRFRLENCGKETIFFGGSQVAKYRYKAEREPISWRVRDPKKGIIVDLPIDFRAWSDEEKNRYGAIPGGYVEVIHDYARSQYAVTWWISPDRAIPEWQIFAVDWGDTGINPQQLLGATPTRGWYMPIITIPMGEEPTFEVLEMVRRYWSNLMEDKQQGLIQSLDDMPPQGVLLDVLTRIKQARAETEAEKSAKNVEEWTANLQESWNNYIQGVARSFPSEISVANARLSRAARRREERAARKRNEGLILTNAR